MRLRPLTIAIPDTQLADLRERLERTRWPDEVTDADWDYGTNLGYMKEFADYWLRDYDWRHEEANLNKLAHFTAAIDALTIHFIYERGEGPNPMPLIITHGWPGSFYELIKLIPLLTNLERHGGKPEQSFDVIIPSLPGFGFSSRPTERGWTIDKTATVWSKLMHDVLGYKHYAVSGTDWGSGVARLLAFYYPDEVSAMHLSNFSYPDFTPDQHNLQNLTEAEKAYQGNPLEWLMTRAPMP